MIAEDKPRRRPTQTDVGRLAGVSSAVVSTVVNNRTDGAVRVSQATADRVWDAVRQLGYVPNVAARNLAGGRNGIIGVFTYEAVFPTESVSFYHEFLTGIEQAAEQRGHHLLLFSGTLGDGPLRAIYKDGVNTLQLADGAVLLGQDEDREELSRLLRDRYPFVFVGRREIAGGEASYAAADYHGAAARMVSVLADHGHRRIGRIRGTWPHEALVDRQSGFQAACAELGDRLDPVEELIAPDDSAIAGLTRILLAQGVTCVVADDYAAAEQVCRQAQAEGLDVPRDLSVAALGDFGGDPGRQRAIAEVVTPRREMGIEAVRLLHDLLEHPEDPRPRRCIVPCELRTGTTIAPPPGPSAPARPGEHA